MGVAQTCDVTKNSSLTSKAGATPTPALPTRGEGEEWVNSYDGWYNDNFCEFAALKTATHFLNRTAVQQMRQ